MKIPKRESEVVNRRTDITMAKSLKIPKRESEVGNRRRTDNTTDIRNGQKTIIYKYRKVKIVQQNLH